ncbi:MAG: methylmalonyl-CoA mutase, partial [Bdellovibrionales bacterium]|nr:methylmalonyl-CoA mutase [Bdellovibrionales bacterium]
HDEKKELEEYGIDFIFHPDDGRKMGLEGMINLIIEKCDYPLRETSQSTFKKGKPLEGREEIPHRHLGIALDFIDAGIEELPSELSSELDSFKGKKSPLVLGVTGTGGAGKSSLVDELIQRFLNTYPDLKLGIICVDPSKRKTGGSLLGDRIRMNSLSRPGAFMRSVASRGSGNEIAGSLPRMLNFMKNYDFDLIIAETSGIGQANVAITEVSDLSLYVMTSEFGAQSQLEKIDMIDYADLIAINKADHRGSLDALRDVRKQYKRSHKCFTAEDETLPVFLTQAAQFNDLGANKLFFKLTDVLAEKDSKDFTWQLTGEQKDKMRGVEKQTLIPPDRQNYLAEIVSCVRGYKKETEELAQKATKLGSYNNLKEEINDPGLEEKLKNQIPSDDLKLIDNWDKMRETFNSDEFVYEVRGKEFRQPLTNKSL